MRKLVTILFILFSVSLNAQVYFFGLNANDLGSSTSTFQMVGRTSLFYGNSITEGQSATNGNLDWTTLLSTDKGAIEANYGIGGQVLENGTPGSGCTPTIFNETTIGTYNSTTSGALFIAFGVNDIKYNNGTFTPAGFKARLLEVIDYANIIKAWPYNRIVIISPFYNNATGLSALVGICPGAVAPNQARVDAYIAACSEAANEKGTIYIDINAAMAAYATPDDLLNDGTHPNDFGHDFIADYLIAFPALNPDPGSNYAIGATALTFPSSTNLTNTSGVITPTTPTGAYGNTGLSSTTLTGDGRIAFKVPDNDGPGGVFGFNTANAQTGYAGMEAGVYLGTSQNPIYRVDNGTPDVVSPAAIGDIGMWVSIHRVGSTLTLETSPDGITWTVKYTYTFASSATLYIVCDVFGTGGKIYYPQIF